MKEIQRTFFLGDEWLFYKIYCGNYSLDTILKQNIALIINELKRKKLIDQWFFVRYNDPKNHLRLRLHLKDTSNLNTIIQIIKSSLSTVLINNIVYEINIGTYKREIERYGKSTIVQAEKLFYYYSDKTIELIKKITPENDEIARIFASLQIINDLYDQFEIDLLHRQKFIENIDQQFKFEFNIEKENKKKLSHLYSQYKTEIRLLIEYKEEPLHFNGFSNIIKLNGQEIKTVKSILRKISRDKNISAGDFISSVIHMNINRIFRSKQRQYEMLCYDFINRYYKSAIARK